MTVYGLSECSFLKVFDYRFITITTLLFLMTGKILKSSVFAKLE